jgi:hypothetical protein
MYGSLSELVAGWGKNVFAGGIDAMPGGFAGRVIFPLVLPIAPLMTLLPAVIAVLGLIGIVSPAWTLWSAICAAANLLWWMLIYRGFHQRVGYALLAPVGAVVVLFIIVRAIVRGRRVEAFGARQRVVARRIDGDAGHTDGKKQDKGATGSCDVHRGPRSALGTCLAGENRIVPRSIPEYKTNRSARSTAAERDKNASANHDEESRDRPRWFCTIIRSTENTCFRRLPAWNNDLAIWRRRLNA